MKAKKQKSQKKFIFIAAAVVIFIAGGTTTYFSKFWPFNNPESSTINTGPSTKEQQDAGQKVKETNADKEVKNNSSNSDQPSAPIPQPSGKSTVTASITAANQNGGILQIRSLIEAVDSNGTCTLTLTRQSYSSIIKTAGVQPLASSSTCQGFDIATSELAKGTWNISLVFENSALRGEASKTVDIQ